MLPSLVNAFSIFNGNPLAALAVTTLLIVGIIGLIARDKAASVGSGMIGLFVSIFTAPIWFLKAAVVRLSNFRADEIKEATTRTYLLWKATQIAYLAAFIVTVVVMASGLMTAVSGVYPKYQLELRERLKEQLSVEDSKYQADSIALGTMRGSNTAAAESQRLARLQSDTLKLRVLLATAQALADSIKAKPTSADLFVAEVWRPYTDSRGNIPDDSSSRARLLAAVDSFTRAHKDAAGSAPIATGELAIFAQYANVSVEIAQIARETKLLEQQKSLEGMLRDATELVDRDRASRASIREQLDRIDYFSGLKTFGVTLGMTWLLIIAFVWISGSAIEASALLIGLSRDLAALRTGGTEREG